MTPSEKQRLHGPVTNRTWGLLSGLALLVIGLPGVWALVTAGGWMWVELVAFAVGVGTLVDLVRRWHQV